MKFRTRRYCYSVLLAMLLISCASTYTPKNHRYRSSPHYNRTHYRLTSSHSSHVQHFSQKGLASWYGRRFHGRRTASGERYNMYALTAAHRTLPLFSYVRVTNTANGKSVIVKINDRGPFVRRRVIDLSYTAANTIGLLRRGIGTVKIQQVARPQRAELNTIDKPQAKKQAFAHIKNSVSS